MQGNFAASLQAFKTKEWDDFARIKGNIATADKNSVH